MFAAVRRYHVKPGRIAEVARRVQEGLVPMLSAQRGFVSYHAIDAGDNVALAIGIYQDRRSAEAANDAAAAWVKEHLAELLGVGDTTVGRVIVSAPCRAELTDRRSRGRRAVAADRVRVDRDRRRVHRVDAARPAPRPRTSSRHRHPHTGPARIAGRR